MSCRLGADCYALVMGGCFRFLVHILTYFSFITGDYIPSCFLVNILLPGSYDCAGTALDSCDAVLLCDP
jgi:hypothetical protein